MRSSKSQIRTLKDLLSAAMVDKIVLIVLKLQRVLLNVKDPSLSCTVVACSLERILVSSHTVEF